MDTEIDKKKAWSDIIVNTVNNIREAKAKGVLYKVYRFYFTTGKLKRMGLSENDLCCKCSEKKGTLVHTLCLSTVGRYLKEYGRGTELSYS